MNLAAAMLGVFRRTGLLRALAVLFPEPHPAQPRAADGRWPTRYESLDLWRGLAAIGIVLHHAAHMDFGLGTGRVMLFFVISGYCIAASAESCLRRGVGAGEFFWRRFRRIYPPYFLAVLFWAGTRLVKILQGGANDLDRPWWVWLQNLTVTQWFSIVPSPVDHPGSNPALFVAAFWSLCYEEQFYLVMTGIFALAAAVPRVRIWMLMWSILPPALAFGLWQVTDVRGFFFEFWLSFAAGAAVYYRLSVFKDRRICWLIDALLLLIAVAGLLGLRFDPRIAEHADRSKWHEWAIASIFCLVLVFTRPLDRWVSGFWLFTPLRAVGRLTYSLYLIHQFNLTLISTLSRQIIRIFDRGYLRTPEQSPAWFDMPLQVLLHIGLASVFWLFCEYPFLNKPAAAPPTHTPPAPPTPASRAEIIEPKPLESAAASTVP